MGQTHKVQLAGRPLVLAINLSSANRLIKIFICYQPTTTSRDFSKEPEARFQSIVKLKLQKRKANRMGSHPQIFHLQQLRLATPSQPTAPLITSTCMVNYLGYKLSANA